MPPRYSPIAIQRLDIRPTKQEGLDIMDARSSTRQQGFTLVEILVVVVILAILAAIVIPQFTAATDEARDNVIKMDLSRIRQQIEVYKQQHGQLPILVDFENQLTQATNSNGDPAIPGTPGFPFGPYLRTIPINPFTTTNDVGDGNVGDSAWYYNELTGLFLANSSADHRLW